MTKKQILGIVYSLLLIVVIVGINTLLTYEITQYYASLATDQVNDNSIYYEGRKTRKVLEWIVDIVSGLVIIYIIFDRGEKLIKFPTTT